MADKPLPVLQVCLLANGKLLMKLPKKGARWQGPFKHMEEVSQRALKEVPAPFEIDYIAEDEKDSH
jgi:hypothetical protein